MMGMYFHFGSKETILFKGWKTTSWQGILGSAIGTVLLAILYEGLKNYREHLFTRSNFVREDDKNFMFSGIHLLQTFLHMVHLVIGYFLMFIFMTYNVWLCISVAVGAGFGYWIFAWSQRSVYNQDCCT